MKARKPSGQILIIFETDLSQAKSLDEEKLTPIQKAVYDKLSENQKEQIKQGYGAVYRDIDTDTEICSFNMDCYKAPKLPDYLARSIIESCRRFYSDLENVKKYEEWKKQQDEEANLLRKVNRFFENNSTKFQGNGRSTKRAKTDKIFRPRGIRLYVIMLLIHGRVQ